MSRTIVSRLVLVLLLALSLAPRAAVANVGAVDLFFSEYIEGTSNNKALEIFNGTGATINLATSGYAVQMYLNGNTSPGLTVNLTGSVADGDVFVLAHSSASATILAQADQTGGGTWFNGNDAIVLRKNGVIVDSIGQVGFDPATEWGSGLASTADNTLRRKASILQGDTNLNDAFVPSTEWDGFATNTFDGLGAHTTAGGNAPVGANCGGPLSVVSGTGGTRGVSSTDFDGRVVAAIVASVNPAPGAGTFALQNIVPAASNGAALTANLVVGAAVPAGIYDASLQFTNDDTTPQTGTCVVRVTVAGAPGSVRIHDIQGASHISPLVNLPVTAVPGIVTAVRSNGFFMQDLVPDTDPATSEGIFVFLNAAPTVSVNTVVAVSGVVNEFRSGGDAASLTITEINASANPAGNVANNGTGLPPTPVVIGAGGREPPTDVVEDDANGDIEAGGVFDPATDGLDFFESLEGMLVQVNDAVAVGPTTSNAEIAVLADNGANAGLRTPRGGIIVRPDDSNPERIILSDAIAPGSPPLVNVGDRFSASIAGVIDYSFGNYKLLNLAPLPSVIAGGLQREVAAAPAAEQLSVATFNVENLDPGDPQAKFDQLAGLIVNNLRAPDLIAVEEVQDNNGPTDDGTVDASQTLAKLIGAITSAGGPTYQYRLINPVNNQDGGEPGGNIRQVFLFRTDRGLAFVDRPGGTPAAATSVFTDTTGVHLSFSPGRIAPTNAAFATSRKPLAGEFTYNGKALFAIAIHFNSKGGDNSIFGRFQPPVRSSEVKRGQQAQAVANFVNALTTADPDTDVIVLGDANDFQFSPAIGILRAAGLKPLIDTLPEEERYSYVFDGNSQTLDHILATADLRASAEYDVVHVNAEFAVQASDHDPSVALLRTTQHMYVPIAQR